MRLDHTVATPLAFYHVLEFNTYFDRCLWFLD